MGPGKPLSRADRAFFDSRLDTDFGHVTIHTGIRAQAAASALGATAFTVGDQIAFAAGRYRPTSSEGRRLIAHELTHVWQQQGLSPERDRRVDRQTTSTTPIATVPACPNYGLGEVKKSRTSSGHLPFDIWDLGAGKLLVADFGVGRTDVKQSTASDPALVGWLKAFDSNPNYRLKIVGYDDCVGQPARRVLIRNGRADSVYGLLGPSATTRVSSVGPAPSGSYITDNSSVGARAQNRGVVIDFHQYLAMPPQRVSVPTPNLTQPTEDCSKSHRDELARALPLAKLMVNKAIRSLGGTPSNAVKTLLRKYFNDDSVSTELRVLAGLGRIKKGLNSSVTYECENPGSFLYSYYCKGTNAYVIAIFGLSIHLCAAAFGRSPSALAETIIHENSHMFDFTNALDISGETYCSMGTGCPSTLDRWDALDNADSFSTFAQDVYLNL